MERSPVKLLPQDVRVTLPSFTVTRTWRPGGFALPPHTHDHTNIALCLTGEYDESLDRAWTRVTPASVICRPGGVPHANRYAHGGSHSVIFEVPQATLTTLAAFSPVLASPRHLRAPAVAALAARVDAQFAIADNVSPLALEGLAFEIVALTARQHPARGAAPPWLRRVVEALHAEFRRTLTMSELARLAGVHPAHLARTFRLRNGQTIGDYVRDLRVAHAAAALRASRLSIAEISAECGFYDQSHLTRAFTRRMGLSPARYRAVARRTR